jgi:hypothetical protein
MFKKYVSETFIQILIFSKIIFFSDANHFSDIWVQKIRTDAGDNYRIKVCLDY